jgi:hypothetical protein
MGKDKYTMTTETLNMAKRKRKSDLSFLDYLLTSKNESDRFDFQTPDEAYAFGNKLREQIKLEGDSEVIEVSISNTVVRVRAVNPVAV